MNLWNEIHEVRTWTNLSQDRKNELTQLAFDSKTVTNYNYDNLLLELIKKVDTTTSMKLFEHYCTNATIGSRSYYSQPDEVVNAACSVDLEKSREILEAAENEKLKKYLLAMPNIDIESEIKGLRAIAKLTYCPTYIFESKYSPSKEALKKLPTVMRLKCIEVLSANSHLSYNIFSDINEDEFKELVFGSVLRHRERVEEVCNKYSEIKHLGVSATVKVVGNCKNCGPWEIQLTSQRARTSTGIAATRLSGILRTWCSLCGNSMENKPNVFTEEENG